MTCAVLIVNWNSWELLSRCLKALERQTIDGFMVFVFDNGSADGDRFIRRFQGEFPWVAFVGCEENLGFAAANNRLIARIMDSEWIALLNPDAFPEPDWLETLFKASEHSPQYASFASRLLADESPELLDGDGDVYHFTGLAWRAGHGRAVPAENSAREVFSPCAAAALYRRSALLDVGGFDEDYFCYFEDVDLGFRLRLAGHKCLLVPQAVVRHLGSGTTGGVGSDFALYHGHRNLVWTYLKDMPGLLFWLFLPAHLVLNLASILWFCARGRAKTILAAKRDALKGTRRMWRKRMKIQRDRRLPVRDVLRLMTFRSAPGCQNDRHFDR